MKIKTFEHKLIDERDKDINTFDAKHDVKATQTNIVHAAGSNYIYTTVFYREVQ